MKLTNLTITPKLGILVGVTLVGLCIAGALAGYLMQREMMSARIEQTRAIVEMGRNMAAGLQKQVEAGQLTKEAAIAEFTRRGNSMTYDKGAGYLFGYTMDGVALMTPNPKQHGTNRLDVETGGRKLARELRDGVAAKGEILLPYEYSKPGEKEIIRKISYAVAIPGWNMFIGTGAYIDDIDAIGTVLLGVGHHQRNALHRIAEQVAGPLVVGHRIAAAGKFGDRRFLGELAGLDLLLQPGRHVAARLDDRPGLLDARIHHLALHQIAGEDAGHAET